MYQRDGFAPSRASRPCGAELPGPAKAPTCPDGRRGGSLSAPSNARNSTTRRGGAIAPGLAPSAAPSSGSRPPPGGISAVAALAVAGALDDAGDHGGRDPVFPGQGGLGL